MWIADKAKIFMGIPEIYKNFHPQNFYSISANLQEMVRVLKTGQFCIQAYRASHV